MSPGAAPDAQHLRQLAEQILAAPRFSGGPLPQPWTPLLHRVGRWIGDGIVALEHRTPGGATVFWLGLAGVVALASAIGTARSLRRRTPANFARLGGGGLAAMADPPELERRAADAERRGAYGESVRLRFQAGLISLGDLGIVAYTPALRTAEAARALGSEEFERLARSFEDVAYGHGGADAAAAGASREGWRRVLGEARR